MFLDVGSPVTAEITAQSGFGWVVLDAEHGAARLFGDAVDERHARLTNRAPPQEQTAGGRRHHRCPRRRQLQWAVNVRVVLSFSSLPYSTRSQRGGAGTKKPRFFTLPEPRFTWHLHQLLLYQRGLVHGPPCPEHLT